MKAGKEDAAHELVIIRRRGGDHEEHGHGGVWKIAYADFMTAMMAFFLVMWLINSTDEKVITQVASYFNPIKLSDKVTNTKGVHELEAGSQAKEKPQKPAKEKKSKPAAGQPAASGTAKYGEEVLFSNPYGVLAEIAAEARTPMNRQRQAGASAGESGQQGGEAARDPFEPQDWKVNEPLSEATEPRTAKAGPRPKMASGQSVEASGRAPEAAAAAGRTQEGTDRHETLPAPALAGAGKAQTPQPDAKSASETAHLERAQQERAQLEAAISEAMREFTPGRVPGIEVTVTPEGLLISLTDEFDFGMFAIASAEPRPETVLVMEKIARLIVGRPGRLVVRGHTDGRPYKSQTYDNWRLSTARAHMAHYMLVRGGVPEPRFERIEGYADRRLKIQVDPGAAANRRIEILLRKDA